MKRMILALFFLAIISFPLQAQVTGLSGWNLYIDPGHSQNENVGIYNYSEAKKVLRVGLALRDFLLNETDIDTVYICRTDDLQSVSLTQRTDDANAKGAAWYHSIHSDASATQSTNSTLLMYGGWRSGGQTIEKTPNGGKAMSDIMVDLLTRGYRIGTRGNYADRTFYQGFPDDHANKYPYLHVNRESTMPSELSEAGFHTNPVQNQRNMNADWKKLEARTFYWSILQYHNVQRPSVRMLTGIISDMETGIPINGAVASVDTQTYVTDTYQSLFHLYSSDSTLLHNGVYYFDNMPAGNVKLIVSAPGFKPDTSFVTISDTFFTFKDVQLIPTQSKIPPPYLVLTQPKEGDTTFLVTKQIGLKFSVSMDTASVRSAISFDPSVTGTFGWSQNNTTLLITPTGGLAYNTHYTVTVGAAAKSIYGASIDANRDSIPGDPFILTFRTQSNPNFVERDNRLPVSYSLFQNYPNPFNPQTSIDFSIPQSGFVSLKVYDNLGREVATLVHTTVQAGKYTAMWDASAFASGIYFYKLSSVKFRDIKRMVLVK